MARKSTRSIWEALQFITLGSGVSSFGSLNVANSLSVGNLLVNSGYTAAQITGTAANRGIAIIASGTAITSVAATGATSGAVILLTPQFYASDLSSQAGVSVAVQSVTATGFQITCIGSKTPVSAMNVGWAIIR